jgi:hypothetical protein
LLTSFKNILAKKSRLKASPSEKNKKFIEVEEKIKALTRSKRPIKNQREAAISK